MATHALEVALDDLRRRIAAAQPTQLEAELRRLDTRIERALDLATELGDMNAAKERVRGLRAERERVANQLAAVRIDPRQSRSSDPCCAGSSRISRPR
jgi:hypothetical protein